MIIIANPAKPFKVTAKQTLKRAEILADYSDEIKETYRAFEASAPHMDNVPPPRSWNEELSVAYIRDAVTRILGRDLEDDDDFFQNGFNRYGSFRLTCTEKERPKISLEVTYLRSTIARAFRRTGIDITFEGSTIYAFPTAASLGKFISESVTGITAATENIDQRARQLVALVEQYTEHFPQHDGTDPLPEKEIILVTGTTGSLGINALKTLVSLGSVQRIYAFNRTGKSGGKPRDRHLSATRLQGIDDSLLDSPKIVYLEGDITLVNLGLTDDVIQELTDTLTSVLHLGEPRS